MSARTCAGCPQPLIQRFNEWITRFNRRQYCSLTCANKAKDKAPKPETLALIEDLEWLIETGESWLNIPRRLGVSERRVYLLTVKRRPDLWARLQEMRDNTP